MRRFALPTFARSRAKSSAPALMLVALTHCTHFQELGQRDNLSDDAYYTPVIGRSPAAHGSGARSYSPSTNSSAKSDINKSYVDDRKTSLQSEALAAKAYPVLGWHDDYSEFLRKRIPESFVIAPPRDITKLCPRYHRLSKNEQREAWVQIFKSIAYAETGFKRTKYNVESFNESKKSRRRVVSQGLMQVSYVSAAGHGCTFNRSRDVASNGSYSNPNSTINNPFRNLDCGVRIMANQLRKRGTVVANPSYYWSTLNPSVRGKKHWGFGELRNKMSEYKACGLHP